jgi:hypothetical protein
MTPYRDRLKKGEYNAAKQQPDTPLDPDNLPARHAALDELATTRGIIFAGDNLTVEAKQQQIRESLNS